jgi:hypothetical protein
MKKEIIIPFQGYYESLYSDILEGPVDYEIENPTTETFELENVNFSAMKEVLNKIYVEEFTDFFNETTGLNITFNYKLMESPREYNFATDRLFCEISNDDCEKLFEHATSAQGTFSEHIRDTFTSYDGFISYYSNDFNDWLQKPLVEWDHNEKGALITASMLAECDACEFEADLYSKVFERAICNGELDLILNEG